MRRTAGLALFPLVLSPLSAQAQSTTALEARTLIENRHAHRAALLLRRDLDRADAALREVWDSLPAYDRAWADAVYTGNIWSTPTAEELAQRVTAIALAGSGAVSCAAPVSVLASFDDEANSTPFQDAQHRLATIRCHSERACGDGMPPTLVFVVEQTENSRFGLIGHFDEVRSFDGFESQPERRLRSHGDPIILEHTTRTDNDALDARHRIWCDRALRACRTVWVAYQDDFELNVTIGPVVRAELVGLQGAAPEPPAHWSRMQRHNIEGRLLHGGILLNEFFPPPSGQGIALFPRFRSTEVCADRVTDPSGTQNLRAEPRPNAAIVTSLATGTAVEVAERQGNWSRITTPAEGWLFQTANVCLETARRGHASRD